MQFPAQACEWTPSQWLILNFDPIVCRRGGLAVAGEYEVVYSQVWLLQAAYRCAQKGYLPVW